MTRRMALLAVLMMVTTVSVGCGPRTYTKKQLETIFIGKPVADAHAALGKPDRVTPGPQGDAHFYINRVHGPDGLHLRIVLGVRDGKVFAVMEDADLPPISDR